MTGGGKRFGGGGGCWREFVDCTGLAEERPLVLLLAGIGIGIGIGHAIIIIILLGFGIVGVDFNDRGGAGFWFFIGGLFLVVRVKELRRAKSVCAHF